MPDLELRKLYKLHIIDSQLQEIRNKAANLDPGRKLQGELAALTAEYDAKAGHAKALRGEQTDLELQQKSIDEKLKKIDKDLYGGKVVNPREVEALQKEITTLKNRRSDMDSRVLELWEEYPPAKKAADEIEGRMNEKKKELEEYQKKVLQFRSQLEQEFKTRSEQRPLLVKEVTPGLIARYEAIRQKHHGIGMALVTGHRSCDQCGTNLPEKVVHAALEGKLVTCESCHRILYATEGLI